MPALPTTEPRRCLFVLWVGGGNVPPQLTLARQLVRRGHSVRVLEDPRYRERAQRMARVIAEEVRREDALRELEALAGRRARVPA